MDNNGIRELAALMKEMELTSLEYRSGGESVKMTRPAENMPAAVLSDTNTAPANQKVEESVTSNLFTVKSPMVGVFYSAPGVNEEPYVTIGDVVHTGDLLCMIEAMKIMNEITSERDGVITGICVDNKQVVEYGQPLFRIRNSE